MDSHTFEVKVRQINRIIYDGNDDCAGIDLSRAILSLVKHRDLVELRKITNEINDINIKVPRR
jgi:hypothetical protein